MTGTFIFVIVTWCVIAGTGAVVAIFACFEKQTVWRSKRNPSRERDPNSHFGDHIRSTSDGSLGFPTIHPLRILGSFSFSESTRMSQYEPDYLGWQQDYPRLPTPPPVYTGQSMAPLYLTLPTCPPYSAESEICTANHSINSDISSSLLC